MEGPLRIRKKSFVLIFLWASWKFETVFYYSQIIYRGLHKFSIGPLPNIAPRSRAYFLVNYNPDLGITSLPIYGSISHKIICHLLFAFQHCGKPKLGKKKT
jgi:hypothetical protein